MSVIARAVALTAVLLLGASQASADAKPPKPPVLPPAAGAAANAPASQSGGAGATANPPATQFEVLTNVSGEPPRLGLNDELVVHIIGTMPDVSTTALRMGGYSPGITPRIDPAAETVTFPLQRTSDPENRTMWSHFLGMPFSHEITEVPISVEVSGKPLPFHASPSDPRKSHKAAIDLVSYSPGLMTLGLGLAASVVAATIFMAYSTTMIRDTAIPQLSKSDRPFSLGRFQMTFWFCLIFASFVFIGIVTFDINSITPQSFILLGISAATAAGAMAVDQTNVQKMKDIQTKVTALGITTGAQVDALAAANRVRPGDPANSILPDTKVGTNLAPTVVQLWKAYQDAIVEVRSDGFLRDLVNDINGPTIHRWQNLIWTIVLGGIYVAWVYMRLETPNFDTNLLTLMGISGVTYVGFKVGEKQTP